MSKKNKNEGVKIYTFCPQKLFIHTVNATNEELRDLTCNGISK